MRHLDGDDDHELTRRTVTIASRIMFPTYIVVDALFAFLYIFDPQHRLVANPSLELARMMLPLPVWGIVFATIAALMAWGLLAHTGKQRFLFALYTNIVVLTVWGCVYLGACFINPNAPFGLPIWPFTVAVACYASARSLEQREVA